MGDTGCVALTASVTELLESDEVREQVLAMLASGASTEAFLRLFTGTADHGMATLARAEVAELPATLVEMVVNTWAVAEASGKQFVLRSVAPDRPLEFAHAGRTRVTLDMEAERVTVSLSHVPGHHAAWYAPPVSASTAGR